jgi:Secretion system C-terminal sorting domain/Redoxin
MKHTLTLLGVATLGLTAQAQLPNNSVAPDFTGTDLNGNSWHLYELLDQGKTVIMDVSAAWCGPCWNYHTSGALEELYATHGPSGDNTVMVLYIEGESTNSLAQLQGPQALTGDYATQSQGDWITGTDYPIIDETNIGDTYQIAYFPTIYKICPNRIVTEVGQIPAADLYASTESCLGAAEAGTNAALITYTGAATACVESSMNIPVVFQNRGTAPLTSCTLEVREGVNMIASQSWTGTLATYAVATVTFSNVAYTDPSLLSVHVVTPDVDASDDVIDLPIVALPNAQANITFNLTLDSYCAETTWKLRNSANAVVESGGPYVCNANGGGADAHDLKTYSWTLPYDCYSLELIDSYGDGLFSDYQGTDASLNGRWDLRDGSNDLLWEGNPDVDINQIYYTSTKGGMKVNEPAGIEENDLSNSLTIRPNPSNGLVYVNYSLTAGSEVRLEVFNALGELVMNSNSAVPPGMQSKQLDLSGLNDGVYYLNLIANGQKTARLITISK